MTRTLTLNIDLHGEDHMPCDSVTTQFTNLANAIPAVLAEALKAIGWEDIQITPTRINAYRPTGAALEWNKGAGLRITATNPERHQRELTQAYAKAAVSYAAQRAGWTVTAGKTANTLTLNRR